METTSLFDDQPHIDPEPENYDMTVTIHLGDRIWYKDGRVFLVTKAGLILIGDTSPYEVDNRDYDVDLSVDQNSNSNSNMERGSSQL